MAMPTPTTPEEPTERWGTIYPEKVRALRTSCGMSVRAAARCAGFKSHSAWSRIENGGRRNPSVQTAYSIATALKVNVDSIIFKPGEDAR